MLNYTEKPPKHLYPKFNGYGNIGQRKVWTSLVSAYCDVILGVSGGWARATTIAFPRYRQMQLSDLGYGTVYSGWKSVDKYDTCASVFVVLFNGFMSLTSYFDEKYRY